MKELKGFAGQTEYDLRVQRSRQLSNSNKLVYISNIPSNNDVRCIKILQKMYKIFKLSGGSSDAETMLSVPDP